MPSAVTRRLCGVCFSRSGAVDGCGGKSQFSGGGLSWASSQSVGPVALSHRRSSSSSSPPPSPSVPRRHPRRAGIPPSPGVTTHPLNLGTRSEMKLIRCAGTRGPIAHHRRAPGLPAYRADTVRRCLTNDSRHAWPAIRAARQMTVLRGVADLNSRLEKRRDHSAVRYVSYLRYVLRQSII